MQEAMEVVCLCKTHGKQNREHSCRILIGSVCQVNSKILSDLIEDIDSVHLFVVHFDKLEHSKRHTYVCAKLMIAQDHTMDP